MGIVELLAKKKGKPEGVIETFLLDASIKYRVYKIPKRTYGYRVIAHPSRELKDYQRVFLNCYLLPVHPCAMAYRKGLSIRDNAEAHRKQRYLLKMDLENFFNSIDPPLFWKVWHDHQNLFPVPSEDEKRIFEQLLFWSRSKKKGGKLMLSVGAPSSPMISNFCLYKFDGMLTAYCKERGMTYTRYADDLILSTNERGALFEVPMQVREMLNSEFGNKLTINHAKTVFSSMAHNRHITGVTIANTGALSLGRARKRYIKHLVHQFVTGLITKEDIAHLKGVLANAQHIEPSFLRSLADKYGHGVLKTIREV